MPQEVGTSGNGTGLSIILVVFGCVTLLSTTWKTQVVLLGGNPIMSPSISFVVTQHWENSSRWVFLDGNPVV